MKDGRTLWAHTERQKVEMCVTFKSFPTLFVTLKPERVPLFVWHKS